VCIVVYIYIYTHTHAHTCVGSASSRRAREVRAVEEHDSTFPCCSCHCFHSQSCRNLRHVMAVRLGSCVVKTRHQFDHFLICLRMPHDKRGTRRSSRLHAAGFCVPARRPVLQAAPLPESRWGVEAPSRSPKWCYCHALLTCHEIKPE